MWESSRSKVKSLVESTFSPDVIDRWIHQQFECKRSEDSPNHRCSDALHPVGPCAYRPHDRDHASGHRRRCHELGSHSSRGSLENGFAKILRTIQTPLTLRPFVGMV